MSRRPTDRPNRSHPDRPPTGASRRLLGGHRDRRPADATHRANCTSPLNFTRTPKIQQTSNKYGERAAEPKTASAVRGRRGQRLATARRGADRRELCSQIATCNKKKRTAHHEPTRELSRGARGAVVRQHAPGNRTRTRPGLQTRAARDRTHHTVCGEAAGRVQPILAAHPIDLGDTLTRSIMPIGHHQRVRSADITNGPDAQTRSPH